MNYDIRETVIKSGLIRKHQHIVLGLSGGPDSVCLFHILMSLKEAYDLQIHPVHVNHMIRPEGAEHDQHYVEELCSRHHLKLKLVRFDCNAMAEATGMTSEEAGRKVRYESFRDRARELESAGIPAADIAIATAHNADDQAETILFRLLRGTGVDGMAGIEARRRDPAGYDIIRPLLTVNKNSILVYCDDHALDPCIDETNSQAVYARNKIRLELIPELEEYNPRIKEALVRLGKSAQEDREILEDMAERSYQLHAQIETESEIVMDGDLATTADAICRRVLMIALRKLGMTEDVTYAHYEGIRRILDSESPSASMDLPRGYQVRREYEKIVVTAPMIKRDRSSRLKLRILSYERYEEEKARGLKAAAYDYDDLVERFGPDPEKYILLRTREAGDVLPIKGGNKKLQDLFVDQKVPKARRDEIRMVCLGKEVLFIPAGDGMKRPRYAQIAGVSELTIRVLVVELVEE